MHDGRASRGEADESSRAGLKDLASSRPAQVPSAGRQGWRGALPDHSARLGCARRSRCRRDHVPNAGGRGRRHDGAGPRGRTQQHWHGPRTPPYNPTARWQAACTPRATRWPHHPDGVRRSGASLAGSRRWRPTDSATQSILASATPSSWWLPRRPPTFPITCAGSPA